MPAIPCQFSFGRSIGHSEPEIPVDASGCRDPSNPRYDPVEEMDVESCVGFTRRSRRGLDGSEEGK